MKSGWRYRVNLALRRASGYQLTKAPAVGVHRRPASPDLPGTAPVRIVTATTLTLEDFHNESYLGRSLAAIPTALRPRLSVFADNKGPSARGLTSVYNQALNDAEPGEILVLLHDDVHLHDWYIASRAREAMQHFDIAGIAGSVRGTLAEPSWCWIFDEALERTAKQPDRNLSGSVNHGDPTQQPKVRVFGRTPTTCQIIDGVLMIVDAERARAAGVRFDEQFRFHFYDLDFCRTALQAGMRIGTWPISVTHGSRGAYDSDAFRKQARVYLDKWVPP